MGNSLDGMRNHHERPLVIMLRGHIRDSFQDDKLYLFIRELMTKYNLFIYIHTWDILQNKLSWRKLDQINVNVNEQMILNYFRECRSAIKNIIIENDNNINLIGRLIGTISATKMPVVGWKNMWYGMNSNITKISYDISPETPVVNLRFDLFNVFKGTLSSVTPKRAIEFIDKNYKTNYTKNIFIYNEEKIGIDNIIIGNVVTMFKLINTFNVNLDNIILKYPNVKNQEFIVYRENNLFT